MAVRFTKVERGGARTAYSANIEVDGQIVGYVQKVRGDESYKAHADGLLIGRDRTLAGVKEEVREYFNG